ncbi:homoprotocatechuate degradation operon regulator HpaR [Chelativorans sp. J32]|uniref:homoprotocatechuate degradation operon regulator HpaR n=1 Tax=Chelativorans sp. J32 TaxID=935840 RepID=UPI0004AE662B
MSEIVGGRVKLRLRGFSRSLPYSLLRAREAVMNRFRPALRLFNITEQQWRVLRVLSSVEAMEVTALAEATCLLAPSLSRILNDMEERGLVQRSAVPEDLRRTLVSITPKGWTLIDAVMPYSDGIYAEIRSVVGDDRIEEIQTQLRYLVEQLEKLPPIVYDEDELSPEISQLSSGQQRGRPKNPSGD